MHRSEDGSTSLHKYVTGVDIMIQRDVDPFAKAKPKLRQREYEFSMRIEILHACMRIHFCMATPIVW